MRAFEAALAPAIALMNRLRYGTKFALIGAVLLVPFGYTLHLQYASSTASMEFNALERVGVEYITPLKDLLAELQRRRVLQVAALRGDDEARARLPATDATIARLSSALDALDARHGAALRTTERWSSIKSRARTLGSTAFATAAQADAAHDEVTNAAVDLILNYAGNYSNLILDPDLDSYWLMDAFVVKMPALVEVTSELATQSLLEGDEAARKVAIAGSCKVIQGMSEELVGTNMTVALRENHDHSLASLEAPFRDAHDTLVAYCGAMRARLLTPAVGDAVGADRRAVVAGALAAIDHSQALHAAIGPLLDGLCRARVERYAAARRSGLIAAGLASLLLCYLFAAFAMSVRRSIGQLGVVTRRMIEGTREIFELESRDEIGDLADSYNQINGVLVETRTLRARIQTVLDNTGDGIITCDLQGHVADAVSRSAAGWFGEAQVGQTAVGTYVFGADGNDAAMFDLGLGELLEGAMPAEMVIYQMPGQAHREGRELAVSYRPIFEGHELSYLLLVVRDVTDEVAAQRSARDARDLQAVLSSAVRDREGFVQFRRDADAMVNAIMESDDRARWKRDLHTLKGNFAVYGLRQLAELVHGLESTLEESEAIDEELFDGLAAAWHATLEQLSTFIAIDDDGLIEIREAELQSFLRALEEEGDRGRLKRIVDEWRTTPVGTVLGRLGRQAEQIAHRAGKEVTFEVVDHGIRMPRGSMASFWSSLVHVVRNAIDHGIEESGRRSELGKAGKGLLRFEADIADDQFVVCIGDDGGGIDWDRVEAKARRAGIKADTRADLEAALFAAGLSTRDTVTALSGRGIGLDAVLQSCRELGGAVSVDSTLGSGTRMRFSFPRARAGVIAPRAGRRPTTQVLRAATGG